MASDAVEVQAVASDEHGKQNLVVSNRHHVDRNESDDSVSKPVGTGIDFDDGSTAHTALSTEVDDMSTIREKFSYGSYSPDGGTFNSQSRSFDAMGTTGLRSRQSGGMMLSMEQSNGVSKDRSLLDDDDIDDGERSEICSKKWLGHNVLNRRYTDNAAAGSFVGEGCQSRIRAEFYVGPSFASPSSMNGKGFLHSDSRAQFYGGYSHSNLVSPGRVHNKALSSRDEPWEGRYAQPAGKSAGSMFPDDKLDTTLDTDSRIDFYHVSYSESEEPLTCREKLEQVRDHCVELRLTLSY